MNSDQIHSYRSIHVSKPSPSHTRQELHWRPRDFALYVVFTVGFYLACLPLDPSSTPGYMLLTELEPPFYRTGNNTGRFWRFIASFLLVYSLHRIHRLQRPFTTRFALYLGRISFSLYIIHIIVLNIFHRKLFKLIRNVLGRDTDIAYFTAFLTTGAILGPILMVLSRFFYSNVDVPSQRLARWISNLNKD